MGEVAMFAMVKATRAVDVMQTVETIAAILGGVLLIVGVGVAVVSYRYYVQARKS